MNARPIRRSTSILAFAFTVASGAVPAAGSAPEFPADLPGSCRTAAQAELDFAVAAYRAFAWADLEHAIERALRVDSECAMAHWLRALALLGAPSTWNRAAPSHALATGRIALSLAREAGLRTERERDYVDALEIMFDEEREVEPRARVREFEQALAAIARRHRDQPAQALLSLARDAECAGQ